MAANTEILIRRSLSNSAPSLLNQGELAYSYSSNTLFIGTPGSDGAIEIGHYSDLANLSAGVYGDATHIPIITVDGHGTVTNVKTSAISTTLSLSSDDGSNTMSLLDGTLTISGGEGITSSIDANTSTVALNVDDTVFRSNTSIPLQTIDSNVEISGNLSVLGTQTIINTVNTQIDDSLLYLAGNNYTSDIVDIGFVGNYYDSGTDTQRHAGVFRHATDKDFYVFKNYDKEPTANTIDINDASFELANLHANIVGNISGNIDAQLVTSGQFLASEGNNGGHGYSFQGDGGYDTGMFSSADGELNFNSNAGTVFTANGAGFTSISSATFNSTATFNGTSYFNNSVVINPNQPVRFINSDDSGAIQLRNTQNSSNNTFTLNDENMERDLLYVETNNYTGAATLWLEESMDIRDSYTNESVLNKGEQKYGVVTQFVVNGTDPVTQKVIIDPNVAPAVRDMDSVNLGDDHDDAFVAITTPFDIVFNGVTYPAGSSSVFVGSNGYLTFGTGSDNHSHQFPPIATEPGYPAIVVGYGDISYQRVFTHYYANTFRIRYEGNNRYGNNNIGGSSNIVWEVVFYDGQQGKFDVRIVKMNGTASDGLDGRWPSYLTDGSNFLDTRADRTIPWTIYTQFVNQLTNGTNTVELQDDGSLKLPNGTLISDADGRFYVDSLASDATPSNVVFYNTTTKELTYGSLGDLNPDSINFEGYSWTLDHSTGALYSDAGTRIADLASGVAIGQNNDETNTNSGRVAIGDNAGNSYQSMDAIAIGTYAGNNNQDISAVAIGNGAGNSDQSFSAVAVGRWAGQTSQGWDSVAVGRRAGRDYQGSYSVAMGWAAAADHQGQHSVAIGDSAGNYYQSAFATAVGNQAGETSQSWGAVAFGANAGYDSQGQVAVAIGSNAGRYTQSQGAVAVGRRAGETSQGYYSVAMGNRAGQYQQGQYAIAIGAYAGETEQAQYSIALNASGDSLNPITSGLYIDPVRYMGTQEEEDGLMFYNAASKEVRYAYTLDGGSF
jgi:hypothetical protein